MILAWEQVGNLEGWLSQINESIVWLAPEIALAVTVLLLIVFDLVFDKNKSVGLIAIASAGLAFTLLLLIQQWQAVETITFFNRMLKLSNLGLLLKMTFTAAALVVLFLLAHTSLRERANFLHSSEHLVMLMTLLIGSFLMTMTMNLLLVYLGIELVSIASYIITTLAANRKRAEAALKYLIFGAVASALMLYGMSWLYGFTGTLQLDSDSFYAGLTEADPFALGLAMLMTLAGVLFKLGAFPMHLWSPDVYEAAPTPIVSFFSVVPKLAALTIILRLVVNVGPLWDWSLTLGVLALGSMLVGNLSALWQRDAKRMLAFSSIAHAGFLLLAIAAESITGYQAYLFYALIYALMNFAAFTLIQLMEEQTNSTLMAEWKGMGKQLPLVGILFLIVMISLTGLPPTAGFNAKLFLFSAIWENYLNSGASLMLWLFIIGLLNTVISLFYYLKIPYLMFFKGAEKEADSTPQKGLLILGTLLVLPLLLLFFRSDWFVDLMNTINFVY